MPLLWLSFATDDEFLGVVITEAPDVMAGAAKCHALGINPGGQVLSFEIPEDAPKERSYPRDTLLSAAFLQGDGHKKIKDCPLDVQEALGAEPTLDMD